MCIHDGNVVLSKWHNMFNIIKLHSLIIIFLKPEVNFFNRSTKIAWNRNAEVEILQDQDERERSAINSSNFHVGLNERLKVRLIINCFSVRSF